VPHGTPLTALQSLELDGATLRYRVADAYWPPDIVAPVLTRLAIRSMRQPCPLGLSWLPRLSMLQVSMPLSCRLTQQCNEPSLMCLA